MAEAKYCELIKLIQNLRLELQELIRKELIKKIINERSALGWDKVYQDLQETAFCPQRQMYVKVLFCRQHAGCEIGGICSPCFREGLSHKVFPPFNKYSGRRL